MVTRERWWQRDNAAALTLGTAAVVAVLWATCGSSSYQRIMRSALSSPLLNNSHLATVHDVVVNLLLTIFFVGVGLELSREWRAGRRSAAALGGAVGGMALPALLCVVVGSVLSLPDVRHAWGVPMATDVAFTLAVFAFAGRGLPRELRVFLLTLAVADDVGSVTLLTFTGVSHVRVGGVAAVGLLLLVATLRPRVLERPAIWLVWGMAVWMALIWAGVEPPLAGVVIGLAARGSDIELLRRERVVTIWSTVFVLPLFALVSVGITLDASMVRGSAGTTFLALGLIRLVGKAAGVTLGARLVTRGDSSLSVSQLLALGTLCAIGFTVPMLYVAADFPWGSPGYRAATGALLAASIVAALGGSMALRWLSRGRGPRGS